MTEKFVTLSREVVKRVMDALYYTATTKSKHPNQWKEEDAAMRELRAALEQPQPKREPLTEKDIQKLLVSGDYLTIAGLTKFARAIENAHNIK